MDAPFTIAHLSDLHLSDPGRDSLRTLSPKRFLAHLSWRRKRRRRHRLEVLEGVMQQVDRAAPDALLIAGDLTHLGMPREYGQVRDWLAARTTAAEVMLVPGNHDLTRAESWDETLALWTPWIASDGALPDGRDLSTATVFPSCRVRGPVALIGVSTGRPSAPLLATGRVGRDQLERLEEQLNLLGERGLFRVVFMHHPPGAGTVSPRKRLTDASAFREVLGRAGAEVVLHGHAHRAAFAWLEAGSFRIPVIGVGSASEHWPEGDRFGAFNLYRLSGEPGSWRLEVQRRSWNVATKAVRDEGDETLTLPSVPAPSSSVSSGAPGGRS